MKKILLTGGSGFIGKNILESYLAQKYEICAPSHRELDLTNTQRVDSFFAGHYFDAVIHAAAKPGHRNAADRSGLLLTNLRMFEHLLRHKDRFGKLINLGSGAVYDVSADNRLVSEARLGVRIPEDEHGFCKYMVYRQIEQQDNWLDLNIFGIFGKYEDWQIRFISNAICKTLFGLPITLRQNRRFSYLYVKDLMPVLEYFIEHTACHKSYNVAPDGETELLKAAQTVLKISAGTSGIQVAKEGYGLNYSADNTRLKTEIPSLRFTAFEQAVQELYGWYQAHKDGLDKTLLLTDK